MNTLVTIHVVRSGDDVELAMDRAAGWFHEIEARCTRFDHHSELMQLTARAGAPAPVSSILFEAVRIALMVAEETGGAFDPTVGRHMEARGFNQQHRTGETVQSEYAPDEDVSFRDVLLDPDHGTIMLRRPLTLDLGSVAKGLAVDTAARELEPFRDFAIDAGGDLYLGGSNPQGEPWSVGIRHPRKENEIFTSLRTSNQAVCTSGDYERLGPGGGKHHILDPRTGDSARAVASATVVASSAMLADALATAAFVLGPERGIDLLHRLGVDGLIVTPELQCYETRGLRHAA
jgi:FAD:protein FMN transferase